MSVLLEEIDRRISRPCCRGILKNEMWDMGMVRCTRSQEGIYRAAGEESLHPAYRDNANFGNVDFAGIDRKSPFINNTLKMYGEIPCFGTSCHSLHYA